MVEVYRTFGDPFAAVHAPEIVQYGAMPFIQMNPYKTSLAGIAAGHYDNYLRDYAAAIARLGYRVAISFAAEANGSWWRWGCHNASAGAYVAAWHHIYDVMTPASGNRIVWVWDVNKELQGDCPLVARWPGSRYVTWVGLDAYWRRPGDTFASAIEPTISKIRVFTDKPLLIAETGVPKVASAPMFIRSLFAGARRTAGVIGIVWFDYHSYHGDYQLQDDPPALAAFRREAADYR